MNWELMWDSVPKLLAAVPLTLQLVLLSLAAGAVIAGLTAAARLSDNMFLRAGAWGYVFVFRGTPLLVQIFLIYYGLGQFEAVRSSFLWPFLREAYWCAVLALALNTGAYASEIIRGAVSAVPHGQLEAARACGMSGWGAFRRIVAPQALRHALPAYGNEVVLMVKASSLASTVTLLEITGAARRLISQTYAVFEIFIVAGAIYLALNMLASLLVRLLERRLTVPA